MTKDFYALKNNNIRVGKRGSFLKALSLLAVMLVWAMSVMADPTEIDDLDDLNSIETTGSYIIIADIDASNNGYTATLASFTGTLTAQAKTDGTFPVISGLNKPLFGTVTNATISNIMLKNVTISQDGYVGAIACTANGTTRIYNCGILPGTLTYDEQGNLTSYGSTVASSGSSISNGDNSCCGSLVGLLDGTNSTDKPRVINCFSYANITNGSSKAGIVGCNNYGSKSGSIRTMVMNCMYYGNITSGNSVYPIYGGTEISNEDGYKLNNYNYFRYDAPFSKNNNTNNTIITAYNRALAAEDRYLVRFEFYRYLLNSNRELASGYVFNEVQSDARDKMAKWVLDKSIAPYPILKKQAKYPSVVNFDAEHATVQSERNKGGLLGTLDVTISESNTTSGGREKPEGATVLTTSLSLNRTDKDTANFNFNYDKVQLPYYNDVGTGNYTKNKVVTGWKVTAMSGTAGQPQPVQGIFTAADQWLGYDFADRSTYAKDLFNVTGRVFSQGAYLDVPNNVTSITIEPYWGNAAYLSDKYYDCYGYNVSNNGSNGVTDFGVRYNNGSNYTINGDPQPVYTYMCNKEGANSNLVIYNDVRNRLVSLGMASTDAVYDNAIVLVGNYHYRQSDDENNDNNIKNLRKQPFTIMSADFDHDNEPDFSFIINSGKQRATHPIRYDFVNVPATSMAHKQTSSTYMGIMGNHKWYGWLEVTNTCFIRFSQLEYDSELKKNTAPVILMGGVVEQIVSSNGSQAATHTSYFHFGGNVWFKLFNVGCHSDKTFKTQHIPISVSGGDYQKFYLSGYFRPDAEFYTNDHAECYISGGRFGELAGAGQEKIDGNVTWRIDRADIESFYGGGINEQLPITGNITDTLLNSYVVEYCGGPKFGNMESNKNVSTVASGCTFGTYYGAGYGGTSLYRYLWNNGSANGNAGFTWWNSVNYAWDDWLNDETHGYIRGKYDSGMGVLIQFEYEHFEGSNDKTVARLYMLYGSLSVAKTNDVSSKLTNCTVTHNFYGGGNLGKVNGDITSILEDCTVGGTVYGAGFSATPPKAKVFDTPDTDVLAMPNYNVNTGLFEKGEYPTSRIYTWSDVKGENTNDNTLVDEDPDHWIHTGVSLSDLGVVSGDVTLTLKGNTTVNGNVFGGGDESAVTHNDSNEKGNTTVYLHDNTHVLGNVYGGGNKGKVDGDSKVEIKNNSK